MSSDNVERMVSGDRQQLSKLSSSFIRCTQNPDDPKTEFVKEAEIGYQAVRRRTEALPRKPSIPPFLPTLLTALVLLLAHRGVRLQNVSIVGAVGALLLLVYYRGPFWLLGIIYRAKHSLAQQRKPKRIVLVRHAESKGNRDPTVYGRVPDNQVELTSVGRAEAVEAGRRLRVLIGDETVRFFVSPYRRSRETFENILSGTEIPSDRYTVREDARLREQDWGNFQNPLEVARCMEERRKFSAFYYRFPNGESGSDVYDRVTDFWASLHREWKYTHCLENFVIVSHGITCRMLLMRYFKWTVEEFHLLSNLENCQMVVLELQPSGRYALRSQLKRTKPTTIAAAAAAAAAASLSTSPGLAQHHPQPGPVLLSSSIPQSPSALKDSDSSAPPSLHSSSASLATPVTSSSFLPAPAGAPPM
jgi:broad specificity phosphatase PhoE